MTNPVEEHYTKERKITFVLLAVYTLVSIFLIVYQFINGEYGFATRGFLFPLFYLIPPFWHRLLRMRHCWRLYITLYVFILFAFSYGCIYGIFTWNLVMDKISHFFSGLVFTIFGICLFYVLSGRNSNPRLPTTLAAGWGFCFSMTVAVVWEFMEFFDYNVLGNDSQNHLTTGVFDTMQDLLACAAASLLSALAFALWRRKKVKLLTAWVVEEFYDKNVS